MRIPLACLAGSVLSTLFAAPAAAQPSEGLAPFFGFQEPRFVKVDEECGPTTVGDFNGDGRPDLAVVNNRKSRIELYYLRAARRTIEEQQKALKVNELPPNPWYDRELISVAHRVMALASFDVDGDKRIDLVYAGATPSEAVVLKQGKGGKFEVLAKERIRDLSARQDGLAIADVMGDAGPEVLAMVGDKIHVYPLGPTGRLGEPTVLGSGDKIRALHVEDFSGDGRADVLAVVPEDASPLRLWVQSQDPRQKEKAGLLAAELRFEMPQVREALPVRFPGRPAASIGVIERASQRLVFFDLTAQAVRPAAGPGAVNEREIQAEVTAFSDTGSKGRSVALADTSGDGLLDLLTNDQKANSIVVYRQQSGIGLIQGEPFSTFKTPKQVEVGRWFEGKSLQAFLLSEEEKAVGVAAIEGGRIAFPTPIPFKAAGATPITMKLAGGAAPTLGVILKDKRDYVLELHQRGGGAEGAWTASIATIPLKDVKRDPTALISYDFDRDGVADWLILTPGEPMMMVHCVSKDGQVTPEKVMTRETIPQFGLVQAAGPDNTALLDADGDGKQELLIADANFIRFCAYDEKGGWRVVDQVNMPDASTQLVGVSLMSAGDGDAGQSAADTQIVASDKANGRLLILGRNEAGRWVPRERIRLVGFPVGPVRAGSFAGDGQPGILCLSDDAFALVRLGGQRPKLEEFAAFRADSENRLEHTLMCGDLNGDGFLDVAVLDGREAMCQILSFSASRKLLPATEFKIFESRLFQRGDSRELQPSDGLIADMTGDGRADLLLQVHDRVIVYPQMTPER